MLQTDAQPHPVAGGQVRFEPSTPDASLSNLASTINYEVWIDPQGGEAWVELQPSPAVFPVRLSASTASLFNARLAEYGTTKEQTVGVGVAEGTLSVAVRQEWPLVSIVLLSMLLLSTLVLAVTTFRGRRRAAQALAFATHQAASREDERTRVAREIHDGPLQELALLARTIGPSEQARVREVGAELRALATDLRPPALDRLGLTSALADLADRWAGAPTPLSVRVQSDGVDRLPSEFELTLYRVVQEALTNAVAHGQARTAWVFLRGDPNASANQGAIDLIIRDDGHGIPRDIETSRSALVADGHFGLAGMVERARAIGGTLSVGSGPGGVGTEVRLHVLPHTTKRRRWSLLKGTAHA